MSTEEQHFTIPNFAYPFKQIQKEEEYYKLLAKENHGNYLFSKTGFWHGGIHFNDTLTKLKASQGIRAIADGELAAFRINDVYEQNDNKSGKTKEDKKIGLYSTNFFLLKHKLEYPKGNILNFFSLYMHTAKKSDYDFNTHKMRKKDTIRSVEKYKDASTGKIKELEKDTKLTLGKLNEYGRYQILQIDNENTSGTCTVDKSSVIPIEDALKLKTLNINTLASKEIQFPNTPISIKAGEVIGLVGENNINNGINREVLHLEIFSGDDVKKFIGKAQAGYKTDKPEKKPKPTKMKIENDKTLYRKLYKCSLKSDANIREGYSNSSNIYKGKTSLKDTKIEVDLDKKQEVGNYTRVLVTKIDKKEVENYTIVINVLEDKKTIFNEIKEKSIQKEIESKDIKEEKDNSDEKYLIYEKDTNKYIKYKDCEEQHPITFDWANLIDESSEDDISIFSNLHKVLLPDIKEYEKEVLCLSPMYKKLFKDIDTSGNSQIEVQELELATKNESIKKIASKFIVKHSTEWDKKISLPKNIKEILERHKKEIKNYDRIKLHLDNEEQRVKNYAFFDPCKSIPDFPRSDKVFHFNPIGLVGIFKNTSCITLKESKEIALKVSGGYEGKNPSYSTLAGNFDGAGMSWGIIQFNFGQNTLGPLLMKMKSKNILKFNNCFSNNNDLSTLNTALNGLIEEQINWAINMQNNHNIRWKKIFNNLAEVKEFQELQLKAVEKYDNAAIKIIEWMRSKQPNIMKKIELITFVALHDLAVQQGSIDKAKNKILKKIVENPPQTQNEYTRIVVEERGATALSIWRADCISRRLGILNKKATSITHSGYTTKRINKNFKYIKDGYICEL